MQMLAFATLALSAAAAGAMSGDDTVNPSLDGGLVLSRSEGIDLVSEDLFVSAEQVRVRYVFRNISGVPIRTRVSLPLPDVDLDGDEVTAEPSGFVAKVDGQEVRMAVEHRAIAGNVDRSDMLRNLAIPFGTPTDDMREASSQAIGRLTRPQQDRLVALGLATSHSLSDGAESRILYSGTWTLRETRHWEQDFPVGRDLVIELSFRPGTGSNPATSLYIPAYRDGFGRREIELYCLDRAFIDALDRTVNRLGTDDPLIPEQWISYNLTTAGSWRAPIGDFRLVVDKGRVENLVAFCGQDIRQISPTQYEVRRRNWRPDRDLNILILTPRSPAS